MKGRPKPNEADADAAATQIRCRRRGALVWCCGVLLSMALALAVGIHASSRAGRMPRPATLAELMALPAARLVAVPLAERNLLCASELCPANEPDFQACAATLQAWAARVRSETDRHQYRFERNPAEFENSPGFFHLLMMAAVLAEDYGVHYDTARRSGPEQTRIDDGFFANADVVFLTGLLGPERSGTCSSLPVLYVAIGRELGYPLKLVTTKGHLFVRWEGEGERFNVETAGQGLSRFSDDYYRHWPLEISREEELAEGYLQSLTPEGEFAVFLSIRGMCLREQGRWAEAAEAFRAAVKFAPGCRSYKSMLATLEQQARRAQSAEAPVAPSQSPLPITKL